jgi:hypothetical protein
MPKRFYICAKTPPINVYKKKLQQLKQYADHYFTYTLIKSPHFT